MLLVVTRLQSGRFEFWNQPTEYPLLILTAVRYEDIVGKRWMTGGSGQDKIWHRCLGDSKRGFKRRSGSERFGYQCLPQRNRVYHRQVTATMNQARRCNQTKARSLDEWSRRSMTGGQRIVIIAGPNGAGKTTFAR